MGDVLPAFPMYNPETMSILKVVPTYPNAYFQNRIGDLLTKEAYLGLNTLKGKVASMTETDINGSHLYEWNDKGDLITESDKTIKYNTGGQIIGYLYNDITYNTTGYATTTIHNNTLTYSGNDVVTETVGTTTYEFTVSGDMVTQLVEKRLGTLYATTDYTYDAQGRVTEENRTMANDSKYETKITYTGDSFLPTLSVETYYASAEENALSVQLGFGDNYTEVVTFTGVIDTNGNYSLKTYVRVFSTDSYSAQATESFIYDYTYDEKDNWTSLNELNLTVLDNNSFPISSSTLFSKAKLRGKTPNNSAKKFIEGIPYNYTRDITYR